MKRTYTRTMMIEDLKKANIKVYTYEGCKYDGNIGEERKIEYTGITSWDIIEGGKEAEEIENSTDTIDEYHEYLVLHFEDGREATFRNSHADMFIR